MNNKPLISICIPCFERIEYVRSTLKSIYINNSEVSHSEYEVIISDNDPNQAVLNVIKEFSYSNLKYYASTCEGFMNSYYVLTYASGFMLKLHNSQVLFRKGTLAKLIEEVKFTFDSKKMIFYTNGFLYKNKSEYYSSFDDFFYNLSYWPSWSNGFSIWKEDFETLENPSLNKLFPHLSLFITQWNKSGFILNDNHWFDTQRVVARSGHNKFEAFTVHLPSIVEECYNKNYISLRTKKRVFNDIVK